LPYYLHDYKAYGRITVMGEFLAIASIVMCLLFILADLGQPHAGLERAALPDPEFRAVL
jgi:formate-dependent nitrite reductase membrane component NrfD